MALTIADVSTGYFATTEIATEFKEQVIMEGRSRIHPTVRILPDYLHNDPSFLQVLKREKEMNIFPYADWDIYASDATHFLHNHFGISTLAGFGLEHKNLA